ncbi:hypothetical protein CROQUDRAFT_35490 [Cronartium quercuum f. sp. fusiforme G11]|uniref:RNI-like protein n=1 Tax=Cronartium quercuum f. sp. fusiforme G11 TaxID=708437 RepID=A0A9P6TI84_9BASI|nr:hypothetical protein CROQUDRAFT_35490 [Cronartium quercuum f. sp. fusiforme G11]
MESQTQLSSQSASDLASASAPSSELQLPPRPRTPPHRQFPPKQPLKGILKPPPPPQAKFNFKRDILNPFSTRLGYAAVEESPLGAVVGVQAAAGWVGSAFKRLGAVAVAEKAKLDEAILAQGSQPQQSASSTTFTSTLNALKTKPTRSQNTDQRTLTSTDPIDGSNAQLSLSRLTSLSPLSATTSFEPPNIHPSPSSSAPPPSSLPTSQAVLSITTLKKVHFTMSDLKVVYPISNTQPPSFDQLNKSRINQARRLILSNRNSRINQSTQRGSESNSQVTSRSKTHSVNGWNAANLEVLYDECCKTREEGWGVVKIRQILKDSAPNPPKVIDLTGVQLNTNGLVEVLGDMLSVDFGLKSLVLEGCGLEDDGLKPILHALLVSGNLPSLSLANNKKLRAKGWKLVAIFLKKAKALRDLDLSDNSFDKRSIEYLLQALAGPNRKDDYYVPKPIENQPSDLPSPSAPFDVSATQSSQSTLPGDRELTKLQRCSDDPASAALPSDIPVSTSEEEEQSLFQKAPLLREDPPSPAFQALSAISALPKAGPSNLISLRLDRCNLKIPHLDLLGHGIRLSKLKHISLRQNKIGNLGAVALAVMIRDWPTQFNSSSSAGVLNNLDIGLDSNLHTPIFGVDADDVAVRVPARFEGSNSVTARQTNLLTEGSRAPSQPVVPFSNASTADTPEDQSTESITPTNQEPTNDITSIIQQEMKKANEQRIKLKSKIDPLPKMGQLLTLDVKSNDLRSADVFYLAQVLKKNRTLKVLNLADNKIDPVGLVHLSDALRFNTCLETLDLSKNPCCGTGLEGILALRTTCAINTTLKRLFLSQTDLSSEGAIALAEFVPEMRSLIHLDLTENHSIDIAGVMALAVSVKMNTTLRCLDINIPPNDPDFARLSQDILQSCVRNTEFAQQQALERGNLTTISQPMLKSTVVKELFTRQQNTGTPNSRRLHSTVSTSKRQPKSDLPSSDSVVEGILVAAEATCGILADLVREDERRKLAIQRERRAAIVECSDLVRELVDQAKASRVQIDEALVAITSDEIQMRATSVDLQLKKTIEYAETIYKRGPPQRVNSIPPPTNVVGSLGSLATSQITLASSDSVTESLSDSIIGTLPVNLPTRHIPTKSTLCEEPSSIPHPSTGLHVDIGKLSSVLPSDKQIDERNGDGDIEEEGQEEMSLPHPPRSPVETHSRSLTLEEGEVFRKGTVLGTADLDDEETQEVPGEILKESILVAEVKRNPRTSLESDQDLSVDEHSLEKSNELQETISTDTDEEDKQ